MFWVLRSFRGARPEFHQQFLDLSPSLITPPPSADPPNLILQTEGWERGGGGYNSRVQREEQLPSDRTSIHYMSTPLQFKIQIAIQQRRTMYGCN